MDPTAKDHQGNDWGTQYRSGIYYFTMDQHDEAVKSRDALQRKYEAPIATGCTGNDLKRRRDFDGDARQYARPSSLKATWSLSTAQVTEIEPASHFWPAEDYHQQYLQKLGQTAAKGRCDAINCYG